MELSKFVSPSSSSMLISVVTWTDSEMLEISDSLSIGESVLEAYGKSFQNYVYDLIAPMTCVLSKTDRAPAFPRVRLRCIQESGFLARI